MEIIEHHDPERWDELVRGFPITSALQGWGWGEVKAVSGWQAQRLELKGLAAAQILRKRIAPGFSILYAPRGPALGSLDDLPAFAHALEAWAKPGDIYLKIEPEQALPGDAPIPQDLGPLRYAESLQPEHTIFVSLEQPPEKILAGMHQMARRNVKKSLKEGVETKSEHTLEHFWPLFEETNARSSLLQFDKRYYQTVLDACNAYGGEAFVMSAFHGGEALATGLFVGFAGRLYYLYGGSSRSHSEVRAPYAMHWAVMNYGIQQGYKTYDLWGIPRVLSEEKHSYGVYKFKERFGGSRVRMPAYDLPLSPLYATMTGALRLRKSWRNYRVRGTADDVL